MVTELLQKYLWLVQTFIRAGENGLSLEDITDKWEMRFDTSYSRRTFNNHRAAVEEVFGISIGCNRSTNRYFIKSGEDLADDNGESAWLINSFTVNNMLRLSKEKLQGRVSVEDIPSGHLYLTQVMEAMTENLEVVIEYHKYTSSESETLTIYPYAVKEYAKRWYIVAYCEEREGLRVYGLDRVKKMEVTGKQFKMKSGFDVDEIFSTSFGIYLPGEKGQIIKFKVSGKIFVARLFVLVHLDKFGFYGLQSTNEICPFFVRVSYHIFCQNVTDFLLAFVRLLRNKYIM